MLPGKRRREPGDLLVVATFGRVWFVWAACAVCVCASGFSILIRGLPCSSRTFSHASSFRV